MEYVEELVACGQLEVGVELLDTAHGQEHGDGWTHGEEVGDAKVELRILDVHLTCAGKAVADTRRLLLATLSLPQGVQIALDRRADAILLLLDRVEFVEEKAARTHRNAQLAQVRIAQQALYTHSNPSTRTRFSLEQSKFRNER